MFHICFPFNLYNKAAYICGESCEFSSLTFVDIKPSYYHIPVKREGESDEYSLPFMHQKGKKLLALFQFED